MTQLTIRLQAVEFEYNSRSLGICPEHENPRIKAANPDQCLGKALSSETAPYFLLTAQGGQDNTQGLVSFFFDPLSKSTMGFSFQQKHFGRAQTS